MTKAADRKYVRVYYDDLADEFPEVWDDPVLYWTWSRMLVVAEKMWPTTAEVPRIVRPRSVARLVELGLVKRSGPHGFRIRGLDAERTRRQEAARNASRSRWGSANGNAPRTPHGNAEVMPRRVRDEDENEERLNTPVTSVSARANGGVKP